MRRDEIAEIQALIERPESGRVPKARMLAWTNSPDVEVQAAAYALLRKCGHVLSVEPPLDSGEVLQFFKAYLERCIHEDPHGQWSHSRHGAGWEIASWVASLFDAPGNESILRELKGWLGSMYRSGSSEERDAIVNAALEHLFERPKIRRLFQEWKKDPVLSAAFGDAAMWADHGGDSPIVGRRGPQRGSRKR